MDINELKVKFAAGQRAIRKAVDFQLGFLQEDGGYIWEGYVPDAFHKQAYSWNLVGENDAAHKQISWIRDNRLRSDGSLILTEDPNDTINNVDIYKHCWTCQGAHRLGRFDVSYPIYNFLLTCEMPCGGYPLQRGMKLARAMTTAWMGITALYFNDMKTALRCANWCIQMLENQPNQNRYYFMSTPEGVLATEADGGEFIDNQQIKQCYWEIGFSMILMDRLYQITQDEKYLSYAKRYMEFLFTCAEDTWSYWGSGKAALGCAMYYSFTGDERAMEAAVKFIDFVVETQVKVSDKNGLYAGGFCYEDEPNDMLLIYVDHAACFSGWVLDSISYIKSRLYI